MVYFRIILGVCLLVLCFALGRQTATPLNQHVEGQRSVDSMAEENDTGASPQAHLTAATRGTVEPIASVRLPSPELPLSAQIDELRNLARKGNADATCRLALTAVRCGEEIRHDAFSQIALEKLKRERGNNDRLLIDIVARQAEEKERRGTFCAGLTKEELDDFDSLVEANLHSLSARQKVILALMRPDGTMRRLNETSSFTVSSLFVIPQFQADHSVQFLMDAYLARDPLAIEGLVMLHAPSPALAPRGVGVWLPNPQLFLKYSLLLKSIAGPNSLGPKASQLADAIAATYSGDQLAQINRDVALELTRWQSSERAHPIMTQEAVRTNEPLRDCQ